MGGLLLHYDAQLTERLAQPSRPTGLLTYSGHGDREADGLVHAGFADRAESLRVETRALVDEGFTEYYDPRDGTGIGGRGFSWSAALTLDWLTPAAPAR